MSNWVAVTAPFVGGVAVEAVHWYQLREKLELAKYAKLLRSVGYWVITSVMVILGGVGALYLYGTSVSPGSLFVAGASFPALLTKLVSAAVSGEKVKLGSDSDGNVVDFFRV